jgi:hypothetical protein
MLLEKFSDFEKILDGDSVPLNELRVLDNIRNFVSRALGGRVKKLDRILKRYEENEESYWDRWSEAVRLKAEAETMRYDDRDSSEELGERAEKLLRQVEETKDAAKDAHIRQANGIIRGNARLQEYFDMQKAVVDERVASSGYEEAKKKSTKQELARFKEEADRRREASRKLQSAFVGKYGANPFSGSEFSDAPSKGTDSQIAKILGAESYEEITMSQDEFEAKIDSTDQDQIDGIYKVMSRKLKSMRQKKDEEARRIKSYYNTTGSRADTVRANRKAHDFAAAADEIINTFEKKVDYVYQRTLSNTDKKKKDELKQALQEDPAVITDVTPREINVDKAVDQVVQKTTERVESPTAKSAIKTVEIDAKKFFESAREQVEDFAGEKIADVHYKHLQNDLVNLFGKLTFFYKQQNNETRSKSLGYDLLAFASDVYGYKKQKKILNRDLSAGELEKKMEEFEKQPS